MRLRALLKRVGSQVMNVKVGDRVCLHYNITCGDCYWCSTGNEQFCESVKMLGHHVDGGYAEYYRCASAQRHSIAR